MSPQPASRALTLADVLAAIKAADIPERRRQDMASAVRSVARVLGKAPGDVALDPGALGRRLREVAPLSQGLSLGRWNNMRSLLRAAIDLVRPAMKHRSSAPLSPAWRALHNDLPTQLERVRLSPLMRWLSIAGVDPGCLELRHLYEYRDQLLSDSLRRCPEQTWADLAYAWNRTVDREACFPQLPIERASRRNIYIYPWSVFPASLKADVDAWLDRLAGRDLSDDGPARPARPRTLLHREYQLRSFASALVRRGTNPAALTGLSCLVSFDAFASGLKFYYERRGHSSSTAIQGMASMLKGVARHWVKVDAATLGRMSGVMRRLAVPVQGMTDKNRDRLRAFDDDENVCRLLRLPEQLREQVDRHRLPPRRAAVLASIAIAVELLIVAPVRLQNLASIEVERHLIKVGRKMHLVIPGSEVKNRSPLEFELPQRTADLIEWYSSTHRPVLEASTTEALFPGESGEPKSKGWLGIQIKNTVFAHTGLKVNAHLFRHIGAKLYLDAMPGSYEVVRRVLGHRAMTTTTRFYAGMETKAAVRHFDEVILKRQTIAARTPARKRIL